MIYLDLIFYDYHEDIRFYNCNECVTEIYLFSLNTWKSKTNFYENVFVVPHL